MSIITQDEIHSALAKFKLPYLNTDVISAKALRFLDIGIDTIQLKVALSMPIAGIEDQIIAGIKEALMSVSKVNHVEVLLTSEIEYHAVQHGLKSLSNVKNIIAIASGKGGVGKSTTAVNLALALLEQGARVGILDADIYGPNLPQMLGVHEQPETTEDKQLAPIKKHGLQSMSIGYLIEQTDTPMVWRGPMVTTALQQMLNDTAWSDLDYLIIDLPPGTGDIQLTLAQKIPVTGVVIVTTPQDIALSDVQKAIRMFEKVKIPILGVIENMSVHVCSACGHEENIFGQGGGKSLSSQYHLEWLGSLPLLKAIREQSDLGKPIVIADPENLVSLQYHEIARKVAGKLSTHRKDYSRKFPQIIVE